MQSDQQHIFNFQGVQNTPSLPPLTNTLNNFTNMNTQQTQTNMNTQQTQPNQTNFTSLPNMSNSINVFQQKNNSQTGQFNFNQEQLFDKINNLNLNIELYDKKYLEKIAGIDIKCIDILCISKVSGKTIAIRQDIIGTNQYIDFINFVYCCNIIEKELKREIEKVYISISTICDQITHTVIKRNNIKFHSNYLIHSLHLDTIEYIKSQM